MIKEIRLFGRLFQVPGYLNVIVLFWPYFGLAILCDWLAKSLFKTYTEMHYALDFLFAFVYVALYLAKYVYFQHKDGTWSSRFF